MSQETNPYRPPMSNLSPPEVDRSAAPPAGKGRRFGTFVVDYVCVLVFVIVISAVATLAFGDAWLAAIDAVPDFLFGLVAMSVYYIGFEAVWGRTPGKFVFGTVVIDEGGGRPSFGQIVGRTLCRFIPLEPFSFFGERGWHDGISKTRVVSVREGPRVVPAA